MKGSRSSEMDSPKIPSVGLASCRGAFQFELVFMGLCNSARLVMVWGVTCEVPGEKGFPVEVERLHVGGCRLIIPSMEPPVPILQSWADREPPSGKVTADRFVGFASWTGTNQSE